MEYIIGIGIALAFTGFILWRLYVRAKKKADNAWKESTFDRVMAVIRKTSAVMTPGGTSVYFEPGVSQAGTSLVMIDAGIENAFRKGECAGYPIDRARHRKSVVVLNSELSPEGRTPSFRVFIGHTNDYYNSEWDMATCPGLECDHYVLAAGQMIAAGEPYGDVIAIPDPKGDSEFTRNICDYEFEHIVLAFHDGPRYDETATHAGSGHPILLPCPGDAVGFVTKPFAGLCMKPRK